MPPAEGTLIAGFAEPSDDIAEGGAFGAIGNGVILPAIGLDFSSLPSSTWEVGDGGMVTFGPATSGASFTSFSASFSSLKPAGACPFLRADMSSCIVLIEDLKTSGGVLVDRGTGEGVTEGIGFEPIAGAGVEGMGGDMGLDGADEGTTGLTGGGGNDPEGFGWEGNGFISLTGKFGGILISGVKGLGPLGFGGVIPLGAGGFVLTGDGESGGVVDPEIGGLISSAISAVAKRKT